MHVPCVRNSCTSYATETTDYLTNSLANGLLRRPPNSKRPNKLTEDIKEFINYKLSALEYIASPLKIEVDLLLEDLYLEES